MLTSNQKSCISSSSFVGESSSGEINLIDWAVQNYETVTPFEQDKKIQYSYWPRRTAQDSRLDINKTLAEQFDLLRVCDPKRYPAFFEINQKKYKLILERYDDKTD